MTDYAIETSGLTRYYGNRRVVAPLDLRVPRGCIFGFLGRNGAGKSTTIRMLMGLVSPTRGRATVLGCDCTELTPEIRARVGYLAEGHQVYGWMRVQECADFQSRFYPNWNWDVFRSIADHFKLNPSVLAKNLSRGERAGLCLALCLAPEPELLILDDPALGLDPVARRTLIQSMLFVTHQPGRTILFSSHLLSDVERVADRIAVLEQGVLRANCSLDEFRERIRQYVLRFDHPAPELPPLAGLLHAQISGNQIIASVANPDAQTQQSLRSLSPISLDVREMSLEDAFLDYLGEHQERSFFAEEQPHNTISEGDVQ